jgi:hypothetical protein
MNRSTDFQIGSTRFAPLEPADLEIGAPGWWDQASQIAYCIMSKLTKICLVTAVGCLVLGVLINFGVLKPGEHAGWYIMLPLGAIFLGLGLINHMLEREVVRFDQEQQTRFARDGARDPRSGNSATHKADRSKTARH